MPSITTATCCRKNFSQWQRSFLWKLHYHWLKGLWQCYIAVVRRGPGLDISRNFPLPDFPNFIFSNTDYLWFRSELCPNILAQLVVLLALSCRVVGYGEPYIQVPDMHVFMWDSNWSSLCLQMPWHLVVFEHVPFRVLWISVIRFITFVEQMAWLTYCPLGDLS